MVGGDEMQASASAEMDGYDLERRGGWVDGEQRGKKECEEATEPYGQENQPLSLRPRFARGSG